MRTLIKICFLSVILVTISCNQDSFDIDMDDIENVNQAKSVNSKSTVAVFSPIVDVTGTSTLHRNKKGITVNFNTDGLMPGHAYTLWWIIFNNPEKCGVAGECNGGDLGNPLVEADALYAGGHVVGGNGSASFSGRLNEGDSSGSIADLFFFIPIFPHGLIDAEKAEVHAVLRSHGPAVPGIVNDQIGSYLGGCPTTPPYGFAPFTGVPVVIGECGDIIAAVHRP